MNATLSRPASSTCERQGPGDLLTVVLNIWHALLLAAVIVSLGMGAAHARDGVAGEPVAIEDVGTPGGATLCRGRDLRADLAARAPGAMQAVREAGAATPNGDARLWRITTPGGAISHLYGTMHISDPELTRLSAEAQLAYDGARLIVIETTDILDEAKAASSLMARPELMVFTDGTTLLDYMDEEEERLLDEALRKQGMTLAAMKTFKPWMISSMLSLPSCERDREADDFLDLRLARDAVEAGREVAGLETAVEQIEAFAGMPLDAHVDGLVDSARMGDDMDHVFATIGALYGEGQIGEIWPFLRAAAEHLGDPADPLTETDEAAMAAFDERVVVRRNHVMVERALPLLEEGGAFVAVGALHLPGEEGIVELLRRQGLTVERVAR